MIILKKIQSVHFPSITLEYIDRTTHREWTFSVDLWQTLARFTNPTSIYSQIKDPTYFAQAYIDPECHCLIWPNGLDMCPDALYMQSQEQASFTP
jgi:hypothetical protein